MATIDYKQKIKDYMNSSEVDTLYKSMLNNLFPELTESEDEKVKKAIISIVTFSPEAMFDRVLVSREDAIAWLEKQGEKSTLPKWKYKKDNTPLLRDSLILNKYGCVAKSPSGALISDVWVIDYAELAKLPKEELEKQGEQKPVDVRTTGYWHVEDVEQKPAEEYNITGISSNKSQGKLGEIIKNLKSVWGEEDENYHRICLDLCTGMPNGGVYAPYIKDEAINWLKSIKDRVQPQPKQEWSRLDEEFLKNIFYNFNKQLSKEEKDWLISLKTRNIQGMSAIQWTGDNLKEVIDFTGKAPQFGEWFKTWEEYEKYVHNHNNIFKIFNEDGSHIEIPVGAWIIKAPDGYNTASRFGFVQKPVEWSEEDGSRMDNLCHFLEEYGNQYYGHLTLQGTISWLKSLILQNTWKPSEENIKDLEWCAELVKDNLGTPFHRVMVFIDELKKLRG